MLDQIYEAALIPDRWEGVLHRLSSRFATSGGLLFKVSRGTVTWIGCGRSADGMGELIETGLMEGNPRLRGLLRSPGGGFVTDFDFLSPDEVQELPIYKFMEDHGVASAGAATLIRGASDDALVLSLEGFEHHEAARISIPALDELRPHLCRAALLASQLWLQKAADLVHSLAVIGVPAGVLSEKGRLVAANEQFSAKVGTLFQDRDARLCLTDPRGDSLLVKALTFRTAMSIPIAESDNNLATIVHLIPLRGDGRDIFSRGSTMVVMNDAAALPSLPLDLLRGLFDLTAAESRIAQALADGASPKDISLQGGIAIDTVRTHVRSILGKTGQHRSANLVRLLASLSRTPVAQSPR